MLKQWIPWTFLLKRTARAYGVIDPVSFLARLRRFAQPSEVQEPIELLRAGIEFHARGLINTKAIQHNLDWLWPFWVEKQFNPRDPSFIPRAFSFSHVNLTHRSWTAVGQPHLPLYPVIDPRGLLTPLYNGWSIDCWVVSADGRRLYPSRTESADQSWEIADNPTVRTRCRSEGLTVTSRARVEMDGDRPVAVLSVQAEADGEGWLAVALRPYNPEGVQFIERIDFQDSPPAFIVDGRTEVGFDAEPARVAFSTYHEGDVIHRLTGEAGEIPPAAVCEVGMATAAALFPMDGRGRREVTVRVPLAEEPPSPVSILRGEVPEAPAQREWAEILDETATLEVPDSKITFLYDAAVRTLILLSARDVVPGPYTYRRFWFRDACFMLNAVMAIGLTDRARRIIDSFPARQKRSGYFQSQEGEWDSNGQTLWIMARYAQLTGEAPPAEWMRAIRAGADWIRKKRVRDAGGSPHAGLLPPGFSAEHLGPNDYYYWDDFWSVGGLRAAARLAGRHRDEPTALALEREALHFERDILTSIAGIPDRRARGAIPATPYRRMDAGAVGSLVADYPLGLFPPGHPRIMKTVDFLIDRCFQSGGFFQDMIHSGINAYLTLDIAQSLLRAGDSRYRDLIGTVADLASPTGQWPEAIHPRTGGGCMGDGHHGWAAAEWATVIRSLFVREEGDELIVGSGIFPDWIETGKPLGFGPTPTPAGPVNLRLMPDGDGLEVTLSARWRGTPPTVTARVPGYDEAELVAGTPVRLRPLKP